MVTITIYFHSTIAIAMLHIDLLKHAIQYRLVQRMDEKL